MSIAYEYSTHWKDLGSILVYQSPDFAFHNKILITDFENCLIDKISTAGLYHAINPKAVTPYDDEFLKRIGKDAADKSIVILCNQINTNKLNIDMIKKKLEAFVETYKIPILAFFALKPNKFSKPHTGLWKLLRTYYKSIGHTEISHATVVSDFGGRVVEITSKRGNVKTKYDNSDTDRAFAHNIGIPYKTIKEYLCNLENGIYVGPDGEELTTPVIEKFTWSKKNLDPALRVLYLEKLAQYKNPNIFAKLATAGEVTAYMIMIYGAPRTGKTTLARDILHKWRKSAFGKKNEIKRLGMDKYTKGKRITQTYKFLLDRISVIIDGECHTDALRQPFLDVAKELCIPVFHIEVNPGIGMSYLFNHTAVEKAADEDTVVYPERAYHVYQSTVKRPADNILYCPVIKKSVELMEFRY
jgi:DNA 3'-phosphatase